MDQPAPAARARHIDVHHHFYPPEFLKAVSDFSGGHQPPAVQRWTPQASPASLTHSAGEPRP